MKNFFNSLVRALSAVKGKALAALGAFGLSAASVPASAAVTVDFTEAQTDLGTVFAAMLLVGVLIYGFRKIKSLIGA